MKARAKTVIGRATATCLAVGLVIGVRVYTESAAELRAGEKALASADVDEAIPHLRRAARWYLPASPTVPRALSALARIGEAAERDGDIERALSAHRAIRASILSTRSVFTPHRAELDRATRSIARLMTRVERPPVDAHKSDDELRREHLALLEREPGPHVGWVLVVLLGFVSWTCGAFLFTGRAFDEESQLVPSEALRWGTLVVVGLGVFFLGLSLA